MIVILCIDDKNGMMFNRRRQSQDRVLREQVLRDTGKKSIWMNAYSAKQFADVNPSRLTVYEDFLEKAGEGEYCFVENLDLQSYHDRIEKVILYKWNRVYPADFWFQMDLSGWNLEETEEFVGSSHEKITKETYKK